MSDIGGGSFNGGYSCSCGKYVPWGVTHHCVPLDSSQYWWSPPVDLSLVVERLEAIEQKLALLADPDSALADTIKQVLLDRRAEVKPYVSELEKAIAFIEENLAERREQLAEAKGQVSEYEEKLVEMGAELGD